MPEESWRLRPYLGYDWIAGMALAFSPFIRSLLRCHALRETSPGTPALSSWGP